MDSLTIGGVVIPVADFDEDEPMRIGDRFEAFSGGLMDSVRAVRRSWSGRTVPLSPLRAAAVEGVLLAEAPQECGGSLIYGAPVMCLAQRGEVQEVERGRRVFSFSLSEA